MGEIVRLLQERFPALTGMDKVRKHLKQQSKEKIPSSKTLLSFTSFEKIINDFNVSELVNCFTVNWSYLYKSDPGLLCLTSKGIHPAPLRVALSEFDNISIFQKKSVNKKNSKKKSSSDDDSDSDYEGSISSEGGDY